MPQPSSYRQEGYLHERYHYFHLKDTAGQERDLHFHSFDKLVILLSGRVNYLVEDMVYAMEPWDVLLVRHHTIHRADIDRSVPYERIIIYLDGTYLSQAIPDTPLMECFSLANSRGRHLIAPDASQREKLAQQLRAMEDALQDDGFGANTLCDTLLTQLLIQINRMMPEQPADPAHLAEPFDGKVGLALQYIGAHLSENLTVDQLAEQVHLSKYHFMRLFKQETGKTVHAYTMERRLIQATKQIRSGATVNEAAAACGFSDYSSFYRAFRNQFHASPREIRQSLHKPLASYTNRLDEN